MVVRNCTESDKLVEGHTRRQIQETRLMQPKMPDSDWFNSVDVVPTESISATAMVIKGLVVVGPLW